MTAVKTKCKVAAAGPIELGNILIQLIDLHTNKKWPGLRWFTACPLVKREMLTKALTAMSNGFPVYVEIADEHDLSTINRMYAISEA